MSGSRACSVAGSDFPQLGEWIDKYLLTNASDTEALAQLGAHDARVG
ncbi:MAG: hypothetical protein ACJ72N_01875 [Labedaea sp.]